MDLNIFDVYNLRARLSPSLILLSPLFISVFLCFEKARTISATSSTLLILLAFANSVPIIQRRLRDKWQGEGGNKITEKNNRAAEMLSKSDKVFDSVSKERYYRKLASFDESFTPLVSQDDSNTLECRESAVLYLRSKTRENRLVLEENINYGFCRNLTENKSAGMIISAVCFAVVIIGSSLAFDSLSDIPFLNYLAAIGDMLVLLFWKIGIRPSDLDRAAENYSKALIMSIDTLNADGQG